MALLRRRCFIWVECREPALTIASMQTECANNCRAGKTWTGAGGHDIKKLGKVDLGWSTETGKKVTLQMKAGDVTGTLISVPKLAAAGFDTWMGERFGWIRNRKSGERFWLTLKNGSYILPMWVQVFVRP